MHEGYPMNQHPQHHQQVQPHLLSSPQPSIIPIQHPIPAWNNLLGNTAEQQQQRHQHSPGHHFQQIRRQHSTPAPKGPQKRPEPTIDRQLSLRMLMTSQPGSPETEDKNKRDKDEADMSIDEHLSSIPSPTNWMEHLRYTQQELAMLGGMVGVGAKDPYKMGGGDASPTTQIHQQQPLQLQQQPLQLHNNTQIHHQQMCGQQALQNSDFRCDNGTGSSSGPSSSSCSPSSSDHNQHILQHTSSTDVVNHMINTAQLKTEPLENYGLPQLIGSMPMHLNPYPSQNQGGLGPRSSIDGLRQSNGNPASVQSRRSRSSNDGMFKCQFCPKKWTDDALLQQHMNDCRLIRVHECQQCGKRFKARGGLQQHMRSRIHSSDRPYACTFCAKRFTQKSHVDQHERIHTGVKPFICQYCGRAFRQRSQQLGHEATHQHTGTRGHRRAHTDEEQNHRSTAQSNQHQQNHQQVQQQNQQNQLDTSALDSMIHNSLPSMVQQQNNGLLGQQNLSAQAQNGLSAPPLNNLFFSANCANNAMSSLLALSQNMQQQQPGYGNNMNNMALGIINSIQ